jgi:DNA-binding NarL/FixJ family response regulator
MNRPRVLIAEDHPRMREAIGELLESEYDVVDFVERGDLVIEMTETCAPDVIVLDISLPGLSGLEALRRLSEAFPHIAVVILTAEASPMYRQEALRRGAGAFVLKREAPAKLADAIQFALSNPRRVLQQWRTA